MVQCQIAVVALELPTSLKFLAKNLAYLIGQPLIVQRCLVGSTDPHWIHHPQVHNLIDNFHLKDPDQVTYFACFQGFLFHGSGQARNFTIICWSFKPWCKGGWAKTQWVTLGYKPRYHQPLSHLGKSQINNIYKTWGQGWLNFSGKEVPILYIYIHIKCTLCIYCIYRLYIIYVSGLYEESLRLINAPTT